MRVGTCQVDITPAPGGELCGFAARTQPSTGLLDPLYARVLYLESRGERLLWVHCDLIGLDNGIVTSFRRWAECSRGLALDRVLLTASHTHSGPATIHLREAGSFDAAYVALLETKLQEASVAAASCTEEAAVVGVEGRLDLAVDRRGQASAHTDPRVAAVGFRRPDGSFVAVVANYAVHPVALGAENRQISADLHGQAAARLSALLPGAPVVLFTNGACGNLNPPALGVPFEQVCDWGGEMAAAVAGPLATAAPRTDDSLRVACRVVPLALEVIDEDSLRRLCDSALSLPSAAAWGEKYRRVVGAWAADQRRALEVSHPTHRVAEIFAVRRGGADFVGVNAEVFSAFSPLLRGCAGGPVYPVGYANGNWGYLASREAYEEGGYEVEEAHFFYGGLRPQAGSLELLADEACRLLSALG